MSHNPPLVSVVIPTYNRSAMVIDAIESVRAQTYENIEILVIDDGSTDDTQEAVSKIVDPRLRYHFLSHAGRSAARNYGIRQSHGEYIAFLDSDDLYLPEKLRKQVVVLENQDVIGLVYSSGYFVGMDDSNDGCNEQPSTESAFIAGSKINYIHEAKKSGALYRDIVTYDPECAILLPTVMVKKKFFELAGYFDESMSQIEDIDMWRRIAKQTIIQALREPLVVVRRHQENTEWSPNDLLRITNRYVAKVFREDANYIGKNFIRKKAAQLYLTYYKHFRKTPPFYHWSRLPFIFYATWYYLFSKGSDLWQCFTPTFRAVKKILWRRV